MSGGKPTVLVVGPGGAKGFMYLGALCKLYNDAWLNDVRHYCGVSIGSVITLLLCVGYTPEEILTVAKTTRIFNDLDTTSLSSILQLLMSKMMYILTEMGILKHDVITDVITTLMTDKMGYVPTLLELYHYSNKRWDVISYCLETKRKVVFNYLTHPDMLVTHAVECSCTIPLVFVRKRIDHKHYIDGYFADPYPVLDYDDGNTRVLGMYIHGQHNCGTLSGYLLTSLTSYQHMAVESSVARSSSMVSNIHLTDTADVASTIIVTQREELVLRGIHAAEHYLQQTMQGVVSKVYNGPPHNI